MSDLREKIAAFDVEKARKLAPEVLQSMADATATLESMGISDHSLKTGSRAPDFELPNQDGQPRRLSELLGTGSLVLNFYRGGWCPYCNMELNALQQALPAIRAAGADLVAISPERPDHSMDTKAREALTFDVLSDLGNQVAEAFGLVFALPEQLRPIYAQLGIDIPAYNGDDSFKLPIPASYVIDADGIISYHFLNVDYTQRLEPDDLLRVLRGQ